MTILIKRAAPEDAERVFELYVACRALPTCTWSEYYPTLDIVRYDIQQNCLYIALDKTGSLVGAICAGSEEEDEDEEAMNAFKEIWSGDNAHAAYISRFAIWPKLQGQGLGGRILDAVLDDLTVKGFETARLLVYEPNTAAVHLYDVRGFHRRGNIHMYERDWLCMERDMKAPNGSISQ